MLTDKAKTELKEGARIFLRPQNNAARRSTEIIETVIVKLGRKYFETKNHGRYFIDTMMHDAGQYVSNYKAYLTLEEVTEEIEKNTLHSQLEKFFSWSNGEKKRLSFSALKAIKEIILSEELTLKT